MTEPSTLDPLEMLLDAARFIDDDKPNWAREARAAVAAARALPAQGEPVAWTNEAQLGFLKDPSCADIPMAMWAKSNFYSQVPLYAAPVPPADIFEECTEIALEHVGQCPCSFSYDVRGGYDEACKDIAEAIKTRAANRKTMDAIADAALLKP